MIEGQRTKLDSFFNAQGVSENDKQFWFGRLEHFSYEVCEKVIELLEVFPQEVANLRALQEKRERTLGNDQEWVKFLEEEKNYFANLLATKT